MKITIEVKYVTTEIVTLDTSDFIDNPSEDIDDNLVQIGDLRNDIKARPSKYIEHRKSSDIKIETELQSVEIKPAEELKTNQ